MRSNTLRRDSPLRSAASTLCCKASISCFCQPPCGPRMGRAACKVASILPVPSFLFSRVRADVGFA